MSIIKTTTPSYKSQTANGMSEHARNVVTWFTNLLRTPTPVYQIAPPPPSDPPPRADGDGQREHES